jgi:hypothetical protein
MISFSSVSAAWRAAGTDNTVELRISSIDIEKGDPRRTGDCIAQRYECLPNHYFADDHISITSPSAHQKLCILPESTLLKATHFSGKIKPKDN